MDSRKKKNKKKHEKKADEVTDFGDFGFREWSAGVVVTQKHVFRSMNKNAINRNALCESALTGDQLRHWAPWVLRATTQPLNKN